MSAKKRISCPSPADLIDFANGRGALPQADEFAEHLADCAICRDRLETLWQPEDTIVAALTAARASVAPPDPQIERILERIEAIGREPAFAPSHEVDSLGKMPETVRDYRLLSRLGQGGMGVVYKAMHVHLQKSVALKLLPAGRMNGPAVARFQREMRAVGNLEHPNIVGAHDAGVHDGQHYLVMELVSGEDLSQVVRRCGRLSIADACEVARQAAVGLQHAHERNLIHRDIKPSNLMLTPAGQVKILDLGLALINEPQPVEGELTAASHILGTADYVSPEQATNGHAVDGRADIYSLGCTLFKLLTGEAPYSGAEFTTPLQKMMAHWREPPPKLAARLPAAPAELESTLAKMLAKDPADRFAAAALVIEALAPFCAGANLAALANAPTSAAARPGDTAPTATFQPGAADTDAPYGNGQKLDSPAAPVRHEATAQRPAAPMLASPAKRGAFRRPPWQRVAVAAAVTAALLVLGVVLTLRTRHGEVLVELADGVPADAIKIEVAGNGKLAVADAESGWKIEVEEGEYSAKIAGGDDRFEISENQIVVSRKEVVRLRVTLKRDDDGESQSAAASSATPPDAATAATERQAAEWVLSIGGQVKVDGRGPWHTATPTLPAGPFRLTGVLLHESTHVTDAGLAYFEDCKNLTYLLLGKTQVSDAGLAYFKGCKNLVQLGLGATQVSDAGLAYFKDCEDIARIHLYGTRVSDAGLAHFKRLDNLTVINLAGTQLTDAGLARFRECKNLTNIILNDTQVSDAGLAHLEECKYLQSLRLDHTKVSDAGVAHFKNCKSLKHLSLNGTNVSDASLSLIATLDLDELNIENCPISSHGYEQLKAALPRAKISWSESNRLAAEAVLALGGAVHIGLLDANDVRLVEELADLPVEYFQVRRVNLADVGRRVVETGALARLAALSDPRFDRLEALDLSGAALDDDDLARLSGLSALSDLALARNQVTDAGLARLQDLAGLRRLNITGLNVSREAVARLQRALPECRIITSADGRAAEWVFSIGGQVQVDGRDAWLTAAPMLPEDPFLLTAVNLADNALVNDAGLASLDACTSLTFINLGGTQATDAGLAYFSNCKNLRHLHLNGTRVTDAGLAHFRDCGKLTDLHLGRTRVSDAGLAHFKDCKDLRGLYLERVEISDAGLAHFRDCNDLKGLYLNGTRVSDAGLANFKACERLMYLYLAGTLASDAGLAHFKECKDLTILDLEDTQVGDAGLAHFKECKDLTILDLEDTQVGDAGLAHVKNCNRLTFLGLRGTLVTDAGLAHFKDCKDLTKLDLRGTGITPAGVADLQLALPNCKIEH